MIGIIWIFYKPNHIATIIRLLRRIPFIVQ